MERSAPIGDSRTLQVIGDGVAEDSFRAALLGRTLQAVRRKGKQMWFELSGAGPLPLWHFGMTGAFAIDGKDRMTYKRFTVDGQWPPRFTKAELHFRRDGEETLKLAFSDPRRFGRILLRCAGIACSRRSRDPTDIGLLGTGPRRSRPFPSWRGIPLRTCLMRMIFPNASSCTKHH